MDPVTQTALGAAVGGAFRGRLGGKAVVVGALCGFAPDLDVLAGSGDGFSSLITHRGLTHALPVLAVVAPIVGWIAARWSGTGALATWSHLAFWALVTHPLLDACTTYGTQLGLPLTDRRYGIDAVAIIDPLATLPLLIAVAVNLRRSLPSARQAAWSAGMLAAFAGYLAFGYVQSNIATGYAARQLESRGISAAEHRAPATMFNVFLRRVVVRTADDRLLVGHVSTLRPREIAFAEADLLAGPLRERVVATREGRIFAWFADDLLSVETTRGKDGRRFVTLSDQRYGTISRPLASVFRARAEVRPDGSLTGWWRAGREPIGDLRGELGLLWKGITTGVVPEP